MELLGLALQMEMQPLQQPALQSLGMAVSGSLEDKESMKSPRARMESTGLLPPLEILYSRFAYRLLLLVVFFPM